MFQSVAYSKHRHKVNIKLTGGCFLKFVLLWVSNPYLNLPGCFCSPLFTLLHSLSSCMIKLTSERWIKVVMVGLIWSWIVQSWICQQWINGQAVAYKASETGTFDCKLACCLKPGAYYYVVGCISLRPYKQPSVATKNSTGDSTVVNT